MLLTEFSHGWRSAYIPICCKELLSIHPTRIYTVIRGRRVVAHNTNALAPT